MLLRRLGEQVDRPLILRGSSNGNIRPERPRGFGLRGVVCGHLVQEPQAD
jgi:hypothetical protein